MDIATIAGYGGVVAGVSFMLPQVYKSWKTKSVADLSWWMLGLFLLNCVFWLAYGILEAATPVVIVNAISLVTALVQIGLKYRYSTSSA